MNATLDPLERGGKTQRREFDASAKVQGLVIDAALMLGAGAAQAQEAARTGRFDLEPHTIAVATDADEQALVLSVDLGAGYFLEPARAQAALIANTHLFVMADTAFALGLSGPALLRRWIFSDAQSLADGIRQLGAFAQTFGALGPVHSLSGSSLSASSAGTRQE